MPCWIGRCISGPLLRLAGCCTGPEQAATRGRLLRPLLLTGLSESRKELRLFSMPQEQDGTRFQGRTAAARREKEMRRQQGRRKRCGHFANAHREGHLPPASSALRLRAAVSRPKLLEYHAPILCSRSSAVRSVTRPWMRSWRSSYARASTGSTLRGTTDGRPCPPSIHAAADRRCQLK